MDIFCHQILTYQLRLSVHLSKSELALILTQLELIFIQIEICSEMLPEVEYCLWILYLWLATILGEWLELSLLRDEIVLPVFALGKKVFGIVHIAIFKGFKIDQDISVMVIQDQNVLVN